MATFYNQATLSYNGNVASSNITTGEIVEVLSATKTPITDTYSSDRDTAYVINLVNTGTSAFDNITVTDDLGAYSFRTPSTIVVPLTYTTDSVKYFVNGVQQAEPVVTSTNPLTITGISIPAGGNASIVYSTRANQFAPLGDGASINNTATISGTGFSDITAAAETTPENAVSLAISKSLNPATVEENGAVTYTFLIQNFGSTEATAADDIIFRDTFNPILTNLKAEFNGATWDKNTNYTYSTSTGEFTSLTGQITVPAATYTQNPTTGAWSVQPGVSTLVITGNI
ncbi:MAG: hypothetical protein IJY19_08710 [Ruminococcus sp.]|nr:hypothetical protein [Ruminococcus sp.]